MTAQNTLPCPPQWRQTAWRARLDWLVTFAALGLLGLIGLVLLFRRNLVGAAVLFGVVAVMYPILRAEHHPDPSGTPALVTIDVGEGRGEEAALSLPSPPPSTVLGLCMLILGIALVGLAVTAAVIAVSDGEWALLIGMVMLGALGALFLAGAAATLRPGARRHGIYLTPEHLTVVTAHERVAVPWHSVTEIRALAIRHGVSIIPRPVHRVIAVAVSDRSAVPALRVRAGTLTGRLGQALSRDVAASIPMRRIDVDPLLVLHTLRYYQRNPADRAELGTVESLRRVESRRL